MRNVIFILLNVDTPAELRARFDKLHWTRIVAFQTRNPMVQVEDVVWKIIIIIIIIFITMMKAPSTSGAHRARSSLSSCQRSDPSSGGTDQAG